MSSAPKLRWSLRPSRILTASRIIPAHVPNVGMPASTRSAIGSNNPDVVSRLDIVVDSPPGITRASQASSWAGVRTSTASTPKARRRSTWARNAPCSASVPMHGRDTWRLPAGHRRLPAALGVALVDLVHGDAGHRRAETARHLRQYRRVLEVGGGLDDRLGPRRRIVALEDARADEHRLGAQLHGEGGVGRS